MVVLIDLENVNIGGLQGATALCKDDTLYIFYNGTLKISIDMHRSIEKLECEKHYQKVTTKTPNALDFLLVTILGDMIGNNSESPYAVISNDKGFDVVVKYWKSKNVDIVRCSNIKEAKSINPDVDDTKKATEEKVDELFLSASKAPDVDRKLIAKYIDKYKTKQGLNNALLKMYGSNTTGEINKIIKPLTKNKKGK